MPSAVLNCIFTCAVHAESPSGPDVELVAEKQRILFWEYFGYKRWCIIYVMLKACGELYEELKKTTIIQSKYINVT